MSERIGRYELVRRLGRGGMGEVFHARLVGVEAFSRDFALKRIIAGKDADATFLSMFIDEARFTALLHHPNIVQVFELARHEDTYFIAMELIEGDALSNLGSRPPPRLAAYIAARVADALHYAHEFASPESGEPLGILHRDVSPQNILISKHGEVKLADFGLMFARTNRSTKTEAGVVKGKLEYLAPEQWRAEALDRRTDVYSLGVVLYELLTAKRPMTLERIGARAALEPPAIDRTLDGIVLRALAIDREARTPSGKQLADELGAWLTANHAGDPQVALAAWMKERDEAGAELTVPPRERRLKTEMLRDEPEPARRPARTAAEPTSFIGREIDLASLDRAIALGARILTIAGSGGTGKTRLARAFLRTKPRTGFADLSEANTLDAMLGRVASALFVRLATGKAGEDAADELGIVLRGLGPFLLVLDNFEQLVEHAPITAGRWIEQAPELSILVTSREILRLSAETVYDLGPLSPSEAALLFVDRARAVRRDYQLSAQDGPIVAEIAEKLDGIPLAIELAASRMGALSAQKILERLQQRFELLTRGRRDAASRQATLRSTIDWSWNLLSPIEQAVLAQCSIFRGGFLYEAAEAIIVPTGEVLDALQSLRDKSLVRAFEPEAIAGELRFALLESIREYAEEKLDKTDVESLARRHAEHYLGLVEELAADIDQHQSRLALEISNVAEIVRRPSLDADLKLRVSLAIDPVLARRGPLGLELELLDAALLGAERTDDPALLARGFEARGRARIVHGDLHGAAEDLERARPLAEQSNDRAVLGQVLAELGTLARLEDRLDRAKDLYARALELLDASSDSNRLGELCLRIGDLHADLGVPEQARDDYSRALRIFRRGNNRRAEGIALADISLLDLEVERFDEAEANLERAIEIHRELGDQQLEGNLSGYLGAVAQAKEDPSAALGYYQRAVELLHDVGSKRLEALFLACAGGMHAMLGAVEDAERCFETSQEILARASDPTYLAFLELERAYLDVASSNRDRAAARLEAAKSAMSARAVRSQVLRLAVRGIERLLTRTS